MAYQKSVYVLEKMQKTRELLIASGRELVQIGGWKNCTVTAVAKNANVATGTLYTYFKDITELNMVIYSQIADEELAYLTEIANSDKSAADRFIEVVMVYVGRALRGRVKAYAQIAEPLNPKMEAQKIRYQNEFTACFEKIIHDGVQSGAFPDQQPQITANILFGGLKMTLIKCLDPEIRGQTGDLIALNSEILNVCLRTVGLNPSHIQTKNKDNKGSEKSWA